MKLGLEGTASFISGSSRGIGLAVARALLAEGASVTVTGRDRGSLAKAHADLTADFGGERVSSHEGDFSETAVIRDALEVATARWGKLDSVVACVGTGVVEPVWELGEDEWQRALTLNFHASVRLIQAVVPSMVKMKKGAIVAIGSIAGVESLGAPLPYGCAKAALSHYVCSLAREVGPHRVRVNCIAPGNIIFPGGRWEEKIAEKPEFFRDHIDREVPLQRFGTPEEIADLAAFLCSDRASFITGSCIVADGGQTRSVN
jgi:3-oxoacyl-[acyl-carrier protein] reductase